MSRSAARAVRAALLALAGGAGTVLTHSEREWASNTFSGSKHVLDLDFSGTAAVAGGEALIAALPDHEFAIAGQLVADAAVRETDHRFGPGDAERLLVRAELLLVEER